MELRTFKSPSEMIAFLATLKPADHFRTAKAYGFKPEDKETARLLTDYLVQGFNSGLVGDALTQYAQAKASKLQEKMPHLKGKIDSSVGGETDTKTDTPKAKPSVAKTSTKKVKPSVAKTSTKKAKYPDFTIVARPDRGGFEGWYGGRAEAFRSTVEKIQNFFSKKYDQKGKLLK